LVFFFFFSCSSLSVGQFSRDNFAKHFRNVFSTDMKCTDIPSMLSVAHWQTNWKKDLGKGKESQN
jgi:hypothetical protein